MKYVHITLNFDTKIIYEYVIVFTNSQFRYLINENVLSKLYVKLKIFFFTNNTSRSNSHKIGKLLKIFNRIQLISPIMDITTLEAGPKCRITRKSKRIFLSLIFFF